MALEFANVRPAFHKKIGTGCAETAGILKQDLFEPLNEPIDETNPAAELVTLLKSMGPDPELASSIEEAMQWRQKVKIPREDL